MTMAPTRLLSRILLSLRSARFAQLDAARVISPIGRRFAPPILRWSERRFAATSRACFAKPWACPLRAGCRSTPAVGRLDGYTLRSKVISFFDKTEDNRLGPAFRQHRIGGVLFPLAVEEDHYEHG